MRAAVLSSLEDLQVRDDVKPASLGPYDVLVTMKAAGVCRTDLSAFTGSWPSQLPLVLGHEGAGKVAAVGDHVTFVRAGQRVILATLKGCGSCYHCLRGQSTLCTVNDVLAGGSTPRFLTDGAPTFGMAGMGTWSEQLVVSENNVVPFPDDVPYDIASLIGCAVHTGVGAVTNTVKVEPGASVVVIGGGGIGASTIQAARLVGAGLIVAIEPVAAKHASLKSFGATHVATPDELDDIKNELTFGRGFDYAFEAVGRPEAIRAAWDATRKGGSVVLSGIGGHGARVPFNAHELTMDAKRLIGSVGGMVDAGRDFPQYLELWKLGKLDLEGLITERISLADAPSAMLALNKGSDALRQVIIFD
ncbi:Zn-dependent alcohol dehydrogenase [Pseudarthrobacter sulfonivorans]